MGDDSYILELYRNLVEVYEEVYGKEQRRKYWLVSSHVGEKVVDAGCGVGFAFEYIGGYVICLDLSIDMLKIAKKRRGELGELLQADFRLPPLRANSVDSVLFLSSASQDEFGVLRETWSSIAAMILFEFRGSWAIYEQRNNIKRGFG